VEHHDLMLEGDLGPGQHLIMPAEENNVIL